LRDRIIALASLRADDRVLDIGAGTGLLTLPAAAAAYRVTALDISTAMGRHLEARLESLGVGNAHVLTANAVDLPLADESVDVVLSNYTLHHLTDAEKRQALLEIRRALRPGGRVVIGDMMVRLGVATSRDRALLARFAKSMLRAGPAGLWRLLKNALRLLTGRAEHPADLDWWQHTLTDAGFTEVSVHALANEAGIAVARRAPSRA
jgi:ubiquinone/menaquinone biosynthesis C-methylase UbiE